MKNTARLFFVACLAAAVIRGGAWLAENHPLIALWLSGVGSGVCLTLGFIALLALVFGGDA